MLLAAGRGFPGKNFSRAARGILGFILTLLVPDAGVSGAAGWQHETTAPCWRTISPTTNPWLTQSLVLTQLASGVCVPVGRSACRVGIRLSTNSGLPISAGRQMPVLRCSAASARRKADVVGCRSGISWKKLLPARPVDRPPVRGNVRHLCAQIQLSAIGCGAALVPLVLERLVGSGRDDHHVGRAIRQSREDQTAESVT